MIVIDLKTLDLPQLLLLIAGINSIIVFSDDKQWLRFQGQLIAEIKLKYPNWRHDLIWEREHRGDIDAGDLS